MGRQQNDDACGRKGNNGDYRDSSSVGSRYAFSVILDQCNRREKYAIYHTSEERGRSDEKLISPTIDPEGLGTQPTSNDQAVSLQCRIVGTTAEAIAGTAARRKLVTIPYHGSYLGKELAKAEIALKHGLPYEQESELDLSKLKEKK